MLNGREPKVVNGPEVLNKYVGASEENIRKLFADAEAEQAARGDASDLHVIIFDEIDAICKSRGSVQCALVLTWQSARWKAGCGPYCADCWSAGFHSYVADGPRARCHLPGWRLLCWVRLQASLLTEHQRLSAGQTACGRQQKRSDAAHARRSGTGVNDSVVNQLLTKIDGVDALNNILLIGMTNRKDMLDEALMRPGRLEVQIEIGLPDAAGREQILKVCSCWHKEFSSSLCLRVLGHRACQQCSHA